MVMKNFRHLNDVFVEGAQGIHVHVCQTRCGRGIAVIYTLRGVMHITVAYVEHSAKSLWCTSSRAPCHWCTCGAGYVTSLVYAWSGQPCHWYMYTRGAGRVTGIPVERSHIIVTRFAAFATADEPRSAAALATIRPNSRSVTSARSQPHANSSGVSSVSSFNQSVYEIGSLSIPVSRAEVTERLLGLSGSARVIVANAEAERGLSAVAKAAERLTVIWPPLHGYTSDTPCSTRIPMTRLPAPHVHQ